MNKLFPYDADAVAQCQPYCDFGHGNVHCFSAAAKVSFLRMRETKFKWKKFDKQKKFSETHLHDASADTAAVVTSEYCNRKH